MHDAFLVGAGGDVPPDLTLSALRAGVPVIGLSSDVDRGPELIAEFGELVDHEDQTAIAQALDRGAARSESDRQSARSAMADVIRDRFRLDEYCFDLLRLAEPDLKKVSVVVAISNQAEHLGGRLETIFEQTYPVFELLVLDEGSTDTGLEELHRVLQTSRRTMRIYSREDPASSHLVQWARACELARGDYVWIADAEELALPRFLEQVARRIVQPDSLLAFSDCAQIDTEGRLVAHDSKAEYHEVISDRMDREFDCEAGELADDVLSAERGPVLRPRSPVWDRRRLGAALLEAGDELSADPADSELLVYAAAARSGGTVSYVAEPLNVRRSSSSSASLR